MEQYEKKLREVIRAQNKSRGTADAYWHWFSRFMQWCKSNKIGRETRAEVAVERFLSWLANARNVSANTQNQAFSALCFFYAQVLDRPLKDVSALRAKKQDRVPDFLSQKEVVELFNELQGETLLAVQLMYAAGLRIGEVAKLRIKDLHVDRCQMVVRCGKGGKDRVVQLPSSLHSVLERQVASMRVLWKIDQEQGYGGVSLPYAFGRKSKSAHCEFAWYYVFCSDHLSKDPESGRMLRHHKDMGNFARRIKQAATKLGWPKRITAHCLRHSFTTHSLENGTPVHFVQKLLGHSNMETTERYIHTSMNGPTSAVSPIDLLTAELANPTPRQQPEAKPVLKLFVG